LAGFFNVPKIKKRDDTSLARSLLHDKEKVNNFFYYWIYEKTKKEIIIRELDFTTDI